MYINATTLAYPISQAQIEALFPDVSFPTPFIAPPPYAWVFPSPVPSYDPITHAVREGAPLFTTVWSQVWVVYLLTPAEIAANQEAAKKNFIDSAKQNAVIYMDDFAKTRDYRSASTCCGFAGSAFAQAAADAAYLKPARDSVAAAAYAMLDQVATGAIPIPDMAAFMASLPVLAWPNPETHAAVDGYAVW